MRPGHKSSGGEQIRLEADAQGVQGQAALVAMEQRELVDEDGDQDEVAVEGASADNCRHGQWVMAIRVTFVLQCAYLPIAERSGDVASSSSSPFASLADSMVSS